MIRYRKWSKGFPTKVSQTRLTPSSSGRLLRNFFQPPESFHVGRTLYMCTCVCALVSLDLFTKHEGKSTRLSKVTIFNPACLRNLRIAKDHLQYHSEVRLGLIAQTFSFFFFSLPHHKSRMQPWPPLSELQVEVSSVLMKRNPAAD